MESVDVVVVGGGVAGGAVATALARAGLDVRVLERSQRYRDRVLGEYLMPWGVAEAQRLGVHDVLVAEGGNVIRRLVHYDEGWTPQEAEAEAFRMDTLVPGVPGAMGLGHPAICRALQSTALAAGATVDRGVADVRVTPGVRPVVTYASLDGPRALRARWVVGADGRESLVRRAAGIELRAQPVLGYGAGLLIENAKAWPERDEAIGNEDGKLFFVFPQGGGRIRLYRLVLPDERPRFRGPGRAQRFLEDFRLACQPHGDVLADADPAGPCATYPMHDTWVRRPVGEGVVLVGDAAGYSNPLVGCGLSIALRDARTVAEALIAEPAWSPAIFEPYVAERRDRMWRLRFTAEMFARLRCIMEPGSALRRRRTMQRMHGDPVLSGWYTSPWAGPETAPAEAFSDDVRQRLFG